MNRRRLTTKIGLVLAIALGVAQAEQPLMYLCVEEMIKKETPAKLVYGYIDGKKTDCMSEYEFRSRFFGNPVALVDSSKIGMKSTHDFSSYEGIIRSILSGNRNLSGANLHGMDLSGVKLSGVNLTNADLSGADLRGADLSHTNLCNANLEDAYLKNSDLRGADLSGANLSGAYLHKSDCTGVKGISVSDLQKVKTVHDAELDPVLIDQIKQRCSYLLKDPGWEWNRAKD